MRPLRIVFSAIIIFAVAVLVAKSCVRKPEVPYRPEAARVAPRPGPAVRGRMAIILDDWGSNTARLGMAAAIGRPLTLSILPHHAYSARIARAARANGLGVMLHMPMQPMDPAEPREPHTILVRSSDTEIRRLLDAALASVPGAEGVNNHQGSAITADERVMRVFLSYVKKKGIFFIDSRVHRTSVADRIARELKIPHAVRDVFIDNESSKEKIRLRLREAGRMARDTGEAIAIGHDRKNTLAAIKEMVPELEKNGVRLVLVKDLLKI